MNHRIKFAAVLLAAVAGLPGKNFAADEHDHDHDHAKEKSPSTATKPADAVHHDDHEAGHVDEVKLTPAAIRQSGIRIEKAETRSLSASFVAHARVAFDAESIAHIGSAAAGRVVEIRARVGDRVRRDDTLLVVESHPFGQAQSELLQKRTESEVAAAAVKPSKEAYDRAKKLFDESQGISLTEVQKREAEHRAAVGAAANARAASATSENALRLYGFDNERLKRLVETGEINPRFEIRSPIDGHVISREVTLGELIAPEKEKLLVVADTSRYWVLADVPEGRLAEVGVGSKAEVRLPALPAERITGEVTHVAAEVNATTRTAQLRIVVENRGETMRPGMFAQVLLTPAADQGAGTVAVPDAAVQTVEGQTSVFVPVDGEENTFAKRVVTIGKPVNGYVPVMSGLSAGESFVATGSFILKAELGKSEAGHEH